MDTESNKLNPGDIICPQCNGSGKDKFSDMGPFTKFWECSKCLGTGKLDWIERIVGKPRNLVEIDLNNEIIKSLSEELAKEIDKDILESIYKEAEQTKKGGP